ncbi:hypothetical protein OROMI_010072 [Orobanche minor]
MNEKFVRSCDDIEADKIEKSLHDSIMKIVKKRRDEVENGRARDFGNDFLGSLLNVHHDMDPRKAISAGEIIDECKTFYFAGQETTYGLLSWSVLLLAIHTDWQEKARKEVFDLFGRGKPNSEGIARLKIGEHDNIRNTQAIQSGDQYHKKNRQQSQVGKIRASGKRDAVYSSSGTEILKYGDKMLVFSDRIDLPMGWLKRRVAMLQPS